MKKILLVLPQVARVVDGGVATQALRTYEETSKLAIPLECYDPWKQYNWEEIGAVHIFCANAETHNIAKAVFQKGIPLLISPVFFSTHSNLLIKGELLFSKVLQKVMSGTRTTFDYLKEICTLADRVLPNTKEEKSKLVKAIGVLPEKITVIPNGVEDRFSTANPTLFEKEYGLKEYILSVANIGYVRKNMLNLIRALKKINHPAVLIGPYFDTPYGQQCKKELANTQHIKWIGQLDNNSPMLASAFAGAKVFALPSLFETPGIASMEAALAGATIVTTPFGGTQEYFGDKALYANPRKVNDIQTQIERALKMQDLHAGEYIQQHFSWEKIALRMKEIYISYLK